MSLISRAQAWWRSAAIRRKIAASGMFDATWYRKRYPDIAATGVDPLKHYLQFGAAEGRDPGPNFSTERYLASYPDVRESGMNPLYHYVLFGRFEGRIRKSPEQIRDEREVEDTRSRMLSLGFIDRGKAEMQALVDAKERPHGRILAAWELIVWHLSQQTEKDARQALAYLEIVGEGELTPDQQRKAAILSTEAHMTLGEPETAKQLLLESLESNPHPDLYLAIATTQVNAEDKAYWINKALASNGVGEIYFSNDTDVPLYERLRAHASGTNADAMRGDLPLVTVLMPAYNSSEIISTAIRSMQVQTWRNFELLVIDDCSTDNTCEVVESFAREDSRIRLIRARSNAGPYVARNIGLAQSAGVFVTCNDADDWSHPEKLETQALHLMTDESVFANQSTQARATSELSFFRRGNHGHFIFSNMSSLMFRRAPGVELLGSWDSVRFGADHEFIRRAEKTFGPKSIVTLPKGPLSFQRQTSTSLTGDSAFGYHGYYMGARHEYYKRQYAYHRSGGSLRYPFPQDKRPFPVPEPFWPQRERKENGRRRFDVVLASEFRMSGGSVLSSAAEISAMTKAGMSVGLLQMSRYDLPPRHPTEPRIVELLEDDKVHVVVYGEKISCDLLIVRYPPILQEWQRFLPDIDAKDIRIIVNQPPMSDYGPNAIVRYDIGRVAENIRRFFGKDGTWHPIGPAVRQALLTHHADELGAIKLSPNDWLNIIDINEWRRPRRPPPGPRPRIGRHARDHEMKWPGDAETLLKVYPASDKYEVRILGGASHAQRLLGSIPPNWQVLEFDAISPRDFLAELDVFVYFTNAAWVESFGRVVFEAMAAGVPVIIPPSYRKLFEDAALYAEPNEVLPLVDRLMSDPKFYDERVHFASDYVKRRFGYEMHLERVRKIIAGAASGNANGEALARVPDESKSARSDS